jgi:hypothetical protein
MPTNPIASKSNGFKRRFVTGRPPSLTTLSIDGAASIQELIGDAAALMLARGDPTYCVVEFVARARYLAQSASAASAMNLMRGYGIRFASHNRIIEIN